MRQAKLEEISQRDGRYAYEAYEFIFEALEHTMRMHGKALPAQAKAPEPHHHVTGRQLLEGIRDLAQKQFGLMARVVLRLWGINRTDDFGQIVFRLVEEGLMSKTEEDNLEDFQNAFDLDEALLAGFRIELETE